MFLTLTFVIMQTVEQLYKTLERINGKGYKAYKEIEDAYGSDLFDLYIDHVQGDPFAAPSRVRIRVDNTFPESCFHTKSRKIALCDFLTRAFFHNTLRNCVLNRGNGTSGKISIERPRQEILERTSILVEEDFVEARFVVGLPAFGRKVAGYHAKEMIEKEITQIIKASLFYAAIDKKVLDNWLNTTEDADLLRKEIVREGYIAFVADGSILPRASGIDPRPLQDAVAYRSPAHLRKTFMLKHREISGMVVPGGVTLIVGGGYHGKSTLLQALERGVYNHVPGDGREFVVTEPSAMKIRAEDGRAVQKVDITPFINALPYGKDTKRFSSDNASGSTSQAANTMEAIEAGAKVLLIDEDTSATNFMIRDKRMQQLVPKKHEPITPYIDKVRQLYQDYSVSTVIVVGGSGSYFDVADQVICMSEYFPLDVTQEALKIAQQDTHLREPEGGDEFGAVYQRIPVKESIDAVKGQKVKLKAEGVDTIVLGTHRIDVSQVAQIVSGSQLNAICDAILYARKMMGEATLKEILDKVIFDIDRFGLDVLNNRLRGDFAAFRRNELAAAINRLRSLEIS